MKAGGQYIVCVVNPRAEVVNTFEEFDTIEQARGYAAHAVNRPGVYVGAVIYQRYEMCWPQAAPQAQFKSALPDDDTRAITDATKP